MTCRTADGIAAGLLLGSVVGGDTCIAIGHGQDISSTARSFGKQGLAGLLSVVFQVLDPRERGQTRSALPVLHFSVRVRVNMFYLRLSEAEVMFIVCFEMTTTRGAPLFAAAATTVMERVGQSGPQDLAER